MICFSSADIKCWKLQGPWHGESSEHRKDLHVLGAAHYHSEAGCASKREQRSLGLPQQPPLRGLCYGTDFPRAPPVVGGRLPHCTRETEAQKSSVTLPKPPRKSAAKLSNGTRHPDPLFFSASPSGSPPSHILLNLWPCGSC